MVQLPLRFIRTTLDTLTHIHTSGYMYKYTQTGTNAHTAIQTGSLCPIHKQKAGHEMLTLSVDSKEQRRHAHQSPSLNGSIIGLTQHHSAH